MMKAQRPDVGIGSILLYGPLDDPIVAVVEEILATMVIVRMPSDGSVPARICVTEAELFTMMRDDRVS